MKSALSLVFSLVVAGIASAAPPAAPATPAAQAGAVFLQYADSARAGDLAAFYDTLPSSSRQSLVSSAKVFGKRMDPEVWAAFQNVVASAGSVAVAKSDLFARLIASQAASAGRAPADSAALSAAVRDSGAALAALSKRLTLKTLQSGDIRSVAADPQVSKLVKLVFLSAGVDPSLPGLQIVGTAPTASGGVALRLRQAGSPRVEQRIMRKTADGGWIDRGLQDGVNSACDALRSIRIDPATKSAALQMLPMISSQILQLKSATTADELRQQLQSLALPAMLLLGQLESAGQ